MGSLMFYAKTGFGQSSRMLQARGVKFFDNSVVYWKMLHRQYCGSAGIPGSGAGKGGGAGGSVRESGGGLGRFGAAQEEGYFQSKEREQLQKIKKELKDNPDLALKKKDK